MKSLFTFAFSFVCLHLMAQITITNSMFPSAGNEFYFQTTTSLSGFNLSAAGPDQTWDFTQLTIDGNDTLRIFSPQEGSSAASFPQADLMVNMMGAEVYGRTLVNRIELIGLAGDDPIGLGFFDSVNLQINPPLWLFEAPLAYNQTSMHDSEIKITVGGLPEFDGFDIEIDSVRLKAVTNRNDVVDAWGVLHLNSGSHGVLRQKQTSITTPQIELLVQLLPPPFPAVWVDPSQFGFDLGLPSDTSVTYYFFAEGVVGPIAIVEENNEEITQVQQRSGDNIVSVQNTLALQGFNFYPNPASSVLYIQSPENPEHKYTLQLIDITGKVLANQKLSGNNVLNLESYPAGNYIIQILDKQNILGVKSLIIN